MKLAIIDHYRHDLYIETVTEADLEKYNGCEEDYIKDNYTFEGDWSWDYITGAYYFPADDKTPREIVPEDWFDD